MTDREKLIELVGEIVVPYFAEQIADHLIANGVTVQNWIPVTERLPELHAEVLMYFASDKNMAAGFMCDVDEDRTMWCAYTDGGFYTDCDFEPTHWMPLPKQPEDGGAENA